jgi:hypothetical protein
LIFGAEEVFEDEDGILIYAFTSLELFKELENRNLEIPPPVLKNSSNHY